MLAGINAGALSVPNTKGGILGQAGGGGTVSDSVAAVVDGASVDGEGHPKISWSSSAALIWSCAKSPQ